MGLATGHGGFLKELGEANSVVYPPGLRLFIGFPYGRKLTGLLEVLLAEAGGPR